MASLVCYGCLRWKNITQGPLLRYSTHMILSESTADNWTLLMITCMHCKTNLLCCLPILWWLLTKAMHRPLLSGIHGALIDHFQFAFFQKSMKGVGKVKHLRDFNFPRFALSSHPLPLAPLWMPLEQAPLTCSCLAGSYNESSLWVELPTCYDSSEDCTSHAVLQHPSSWPGASCVFSFQTVLVTSCQHVVID